MNSRIVSIPLSGGSNERITLDLDKGETASVVECRPNMEAFLVFFRIDKIPGYIYTTPQDIKSTFLFHYTSWDCFPSNSQIVYIDYRNSKVLVYE